MRYLIDAHVLVHRQLEFRGPQACELLRVSCHSDVATIPLTRPTQKPTTSQWDAVENRVHVYDLQATILRLSGLDHEQLTNRFAGRDFRLTDVYRNVLRSIL